MLNIPSSSKGDADDNPSDIQSFSLLAQGHSGTHRKLRSPKKPGTATEQCSNFIFKRLHLGQRRAQFLPKTRRLPSDNCIQALSRQADELTKDSNLISRRTGVGADGKQTREEKRKAFPHRFSC